MAIEVDGDEAAAGVGWLEEVQRVLRPGGRATVRIRGATPGLSRRLARTAAHYFDVAQDGGKPQSEIRLVRRPTAHAAAHFDEIAAHYWGQIPAHVQKRFLDQKVDVIARHVPPRDGRVGLDVGCGVGKHAAEVVRRLGGVVVGVDMAASALREARRSREGLSVEPMLSDSLRLPFRDGSIDYAYSINVLHHLKRGEQERALREVARVLRPGATLVVHEMNVRNPLFRWYLRHVFPRVRPIDQGDEEFIHPARWPLVRGLDVVDVEYSTFMPDFAPPWMVRALGPLERALETGRARSFSVHYAAVLRRQAAA